MPSQVEFQRVKQHVIEPLKRHFGMEFDQPMIDDYVDEFGKYSAESLEKSIKDVCREQKRKPALAHIIEALKSHGSKGGNAQESGTMRDLSERGNRALELAYAYCRHFAASPLMARAIEEKWEGQLTRFVRANALAQAYLICSCPTWGYEAFAYQWELKLDAALKKQRRREFEKSCRQQAATGEISVTVPMEAIEYWKAIDQEPRPIMLKGRRAMTKDNIERTIAYMRETGASEENIAAFAMNAPV